MEELQVDTSKLPVQIRAKLAELDTELAEGWFIWRTYDMIVCNC